MPDDAVKLIECPRDAWQGLRRQIPTELKVRYLRALMSAGFKHIDAVSFVSPKAVPQMADSEKVLEQIGPLPDVEIIGRVVRSVTNEYANYDIGVHMHSTRTGASAKVLAAYDAGCRRFDSVIGGLGGCPFAQDALVGNIPTESVIEALQQRGVEPSIGKS